MVFRLLGIDGVGYSHVIKICRYTGKTLVHLCVCNSLQDNSLEHKRFLLGVSQHTIPALRAQSSKGHNIPCISCAPSLEGKFLSKKCCLYMRKYGVLKCFFWLVSYFESVWLYHSSGNQTLASHCGDLGSITGDCRWDSWWMNWHWEKFFCKCYGFFCCHSTISPYSFITTPRDVQ
jgi:hypothetical protein